MDSSYLLVAEPSSVPVRPWQPCARTYSGNMCGIYLPYLPPIDGGAANPALFITWFLNKYAPEIQARVVADYKARGFSDFLVSWDASQFASPQAFADWCWSLYQHDLEPAVMLTSKYANSGQTPEQIMAEIAPVLVALKEKVGRICVGFELDLWLQPDPLQRLIDLMVPYVVPWGGKLYVHFSTWYSSWPPPGPTPFARFWNTNIGKLTGLLWQTDVNAPIADVQANAIDVLSRFAGNYFCSPDSGFGHPFDLIGLELQAEAAFAGNADEAKQNEYARGIMATPPQQGPAGLVSVMGSGNGKA